MKVKIVKHTSPNAWYRSDIGMVFDVHDYKYDNSYYEVGYSYNCILKSDTIPVNEIKYEKSEQGVGTTKCPNDDYHCMVGSFTCEKCEHNCGIDRETQTVQCSWQDEIIGGKEMKRLDISKEYIDSNILVIPIVHVDDYLHISTYSNRHETATIRVGKDYLTSLTKVNAMLKAMELNYELYEGVDWSKVEESTEVRVNDYIAKFHSYVPKLNKVIVIFGESVNVVDEDKVELV